MKSSFIILLVIYVGLSSCSRGLPKNDKAPTNKDTLVYTYKTIRERASDCGSKPDSSCTVAKITYPVFSGQTALNDSIRDKLVNTYYTDKPDKSVELQAKNFIKFYEHDTLRKTGQAGIIYTLESNAAVLRQDLGLVTIQVDSYSFSGGAHGSEYTGFINWDTKANRKVELADIMVSGYINKLTSIGEKIFRAQEKLNDTGSLSNYFFKDARFSLNNNFLVTPIGLRFLYNDYEIKPYSDGPTELLVPYAQIKPLLLSNTVISQYIKK